MYLQPITSLMEKIAILLIVITLPTYTHEVQGISVIKL
jgi:hypothetical protein